MCGIAGIVSTRSTVPSERIWAMTEAQRHRGPDAWGEWSDDVCRLGHRRLAIIDLSEMGRQPLSNEDGTVWITYNGEIYNFQALRRELEGCGHRFRTGTDTEVIVHAYEQWGTACVSRLRGMFAFGLWDQRRRRLFLARDRVGKKPLFYTLLGSTFLFASELQGLLVDPDVPRDVDFAAMDTYLSRGYIPAPRTAFRNVYKLPPAHWLTVDWRPSGLVMDCQRYWSLTYSPKAVLHANDAADALREKLKEAVGLRLMSDVPLGAFLSGGIDSSIVVGLMAELTDRPVKTFSIGFEEADFNELPHARRVAQRWGTDHHELMVKPDALAILPTLVRHYGEPYADSSAIPTYYVSQMTREHVTVALNGDGGDESFAGYERYLGNRMASWMHRIPETAFGAGMLRRVLPDSANPKNRLRSAKRFLTVASQPVVQRYDHWTGYFGALSKPLLYHPDMQAAKLQSDGQTEARDWFASLFDAAADLDPVDMAMAVDVQSYLPYDLLVKVDIASMTNSLEARSPFLDHEVMEFAASLPVGLKLRVTQAKYLLKSAFRDLLPTENVRRRKMGFGVPVGAWMRGQLRPLMEDALLSSQACQRRYFQPIYVKQLLQEHLDGHTDHSVPLWNLLMLELWHREFMDS